MVKIKQKKQLNLPQLLEWAWDNPKSSRNKRFVSENKEFPYVNQYVIFNEVGYAEIENSYCYGRNDLFTVEVEEEITEDTEIPKLMTTFKKTCLEGGIGYQRVRIDENYPIKLMLNKAEAHGEPVETLHVVNDDDTHTLIWRDGRLIE